MASAWVRRRRTRASSSPSITSARGAGQVGVHLAEQPLGGGAAQRKVRRVEIYHGDGAAQLVTQGVVDADAVEIAAGHLAQRLAGEGILHRPVAAAVVQHHHEAAIGGALQAPVEQGLEPVPGALVVAGHDGLDGAALGGEAVDVEGVEQLDGGGIVGRGLGLGAQRHGQQHQQPEKKETPHGFILWIRESLRG